MEQFIEPSHIIKELGGDEDWEYKYVEPVTGENDRMKDTQTRDELLRSREEIIKEFEAETLEWTRDPESERGKQAKAKRSELAAKLKVDYWRLDPYLRARSLYDRIGYLREDGTADWHYGSKSEGAADATSDGSGAVETSADDVD